MYLMYVDESGDVGTINSPTRYFILSGIVVHESKWKDTLTSLVEFRKMLRDTIGLKLREEIHCTELINKPGDLKRIKRNDRVDIIKKCIDWLNNQLDISVVSVIVDKQERTTDIFELAWNTLLMRFENTLNNNNFKGSQNLSDKGMVISDNTEGEKLRKLIRKMRHYNTIPNSGEFSSSGYRNLTLQCLIEDPVFRDSKLSFIHQINDVVAYCVRQKYEPNAYMKKKGGHNFYKRLNKVALKVASRNNDLGLVEI